MNAANARPVDDRVARPMVRHEICNAIATLKERRCAMIVIEKNLADVPRLAERMIVLEKGRLAWSMPSVRSAAIKALQHRYSRSLICLTFAISSCLE